MRTEIENCLQGNKVLATTPTHLIILHCQVHEYVNVTLLVAVVKKDNSSRQLELLEILARGGIFRLFFADQNLLNPAL